MRDRSRLCGRRSQRSLVIRGFARRQTVRDHFIQHISRASCRRIPRRLLLVLSSLLILFFAAQVRAETKHAPPKHSVDLNSATVEQLQQVPGIGPGAAKAIVNFRQKSGPFQKVEDLLAIRGISKFRENASVCDDRFNSAELALDGRMANKLTRLQARNSMLANLDEWKKDWGELK